MGNRGDYLLRALVLANRERRMAQKTHDQGLIQSAEARLQRAWKNAHEHIDALGEHGNEPPATRTNARP